MRPTVGQQLGRLSPRSIHEELDRSTDIITINNQARVPETPKMDPRLAIRTKGKQASEAVPLKPRIPCRFHARGHCSKGTACPFGHEESNTTSVGAGPSSKVAANTSMTYPFSQAPCRFFIAGTCTKGSSCPFLHPEDSRAESTAAAAIDQASDSRSQIPCQFFAKGSCRNGETCPFAHCGAEPKYKGVGEQDIDRAVCPVECILFDVREMCLYLLEIHRYLILGRRHS